MKKKKRRRPRIYNAQSGEPLTTVKCANCRAEVAVKKAERAGKDKIKCPNCETILSTEGVEK